jgi:hypothetical protein
MPMQTTDIPIEPPDEEDREVIPTGAYIGRLVSFGVVEKPAWKIQSDMLHHPDKEPDKAQWAWEFEITEGDFAEAKISDFTSRSWHSKSKASSHACALLNVPILPRGQGLSTSRLVGLPCQIWIEAKENQKGEERSYIDKVLPLPKRRAPAPVQGQQQPDSLYAQRQAEAAAAPQPAAMAGGSEDPEALPDNYWDQITREDPSAR